MNFVFDCLFLNILRAIRGLLTLQDEVDIKVINYFTLNLTYCVSCLMGLGVIERYYRNLEVQRQRYTHLGALVRVRVMPCRIYKSF